MSGDLEVRELSKRILDFLHEAEDKRGMHNVPIATLYSNFEKQSSYEAVQRAISFLADRDLIAPYSYSLTAKGRRERITQDRTNI